MLTTPPAYVFSAGQFADENFVNRGTALFNPLTSSTIQLPSGYVTRDVCGNQDYIVLSGAASHKELVLCTPQEVIGVSLKIRASKATEAAQMKLYAVRILDHILSYRDEVISNAGPN